MLNFQGGSRAATPADFSVNILFHRCYQILKMRLICNNFQSKYGQSKFHAIQLLTPKIEKIDSIAQKKNVKKLKFENLLHLNLECMESQLFWPGKFSNSSVSVAPLSIFLYKRSICNEAQGLLY